MANHIAFENWTPEQVVQWLSGLDEAIQPYVHFFLNNGIDGRKLMMLAHSDLEKMNVMKLGHQELMLEAVDLLRVLRYGYEAENLQFLALQLGCKARSLHNEIQAQTAENDKNKANMAPQEQGRKRLSINNLSSVADLLIALKSLVSWLDRSPFEGTHELCLRRNTIVKTGLELVTASQKEAHIFDIEDAIMKSCLRLADVCNELVIESRDPMYVQPASLEVASIRKKQGEELGMHIQSSYYGIHQIGGIKDMSPAELCGKIEKGDEVIQVNGQTVVGWQLKALVNALKEKPKEVILLLKKRPHHTSPFGQMHNKRKLMNKAQVATLPKSLKKRRSREGEQKQARPMLQDLINKTPSSEEPSSPKEVTDGNDTDNDVFRSGSESPQYTLPVQVDPKQRRATVSGGSPTLSRPLLVTEDLDTPTRPKSFAVASVDAPQALVGTNSPPDERGRELRLGDKLKNSSAAERRQEFKATKAAPTTLKFTVKKPIPTVQEPEGAVKVAATNQPKGAPGVSMSGDLVSKSKDGNGFTFKVSIEHSDEGDTHTLSSDNQDSAFEKVPPVNEMAPRVDKTTEIENAGVPITAKILIHVHDACVSPDDPQPGQGILQQSGDHGVDTNIPVTAGSEGGQTASVVCSTTNSEHQVTKHSVHVAAQLVEPSHVDKKEPERRDISLQSPVSDSKNSQKSKDSESTNSTVETRKTPKSPENMDNISNKAVGQEPSSFSSLSSVSSLSSLSSLSSQNSLKKAGVTVPTGSSRKNEPKLTKFTRLPDVDSKPTEQIGGQPAQEPVKKVTFQESQKQKPDEEKVAYKYIVVGGIAQQIRDDQSPVMRRPEKDKKTRTKVNRRISCKDLGVGDCQGWLFKHKGKNVGPFSKHWHKRWCVLKYSNFYHYRVKSDEKAEGVIHLPAFQVSPAPEIKTSKIAFKVHNAGTTFYFAAERQEDMGKWMNKMGLAAITYREPKVSRNDDYSESDDDDDETGVEKLSPSGSSSPGRSQYRKPRSETPPHSVSPDTEPTITITGPSLPTQAHPRSAELEPTITISGSSLRAGNTITSSPEPRNRSPVSLRSRSPTSVQPAAAAGSIDDLTLLYKNIQNENLTITGINRRTAISTDLERLATPEQLNKVLKLKSLQRTLKAKEHELGEIDQLLSADITHSKLVEFTECHPAADPSSPHSPQSSDTDTL